MDLYAENILDHYRSPRGKQSVVSDQWSVTHEELNASCGDRLAVALTIINNTITHDAWDGEGCAISQAAMSMLSEELIGMKISEADALTKEKIHEMLGVPVGPRRF